MLYRQLRTTQVKCNFCLEWMTLSLDFKFNVNVCDVCLHKGCQQNTLKAVASSGQIYQIYIVKQNSFLQVPKQSGTTCNLSQNNQSQAFTDNISPNDKTELLQEIDQQRNIEIKEIMQKWNLLSQFLNLKQVLSKEQIDYAKNIISQKAKQMQKFNNNLALKIIHPQNQNQWVPVEFQTHSAYEPLKQQPKLSYQTKNYDFSSIKIRIVDKQNLPLKNKTVQKNKQNPTQLNGRSAFKSPTKGALKQKDMNCLNVNLPKLSDLIQNNHTPQKRFNTQFFDENLSLTSSCLKDSFVSFQSSAKSSLKGSILNSITKKLNDQELKKFEQTKNKISKYLQKNGESTSLGRLMLGIVFEAFLNTSVNGKSLELISYNLSLTDFRCYLEAFEWTGIEVLKLVKTKLTDDHLRTLVDFIIQKKLEIKVLVLTGNKLTQASIEYLNEKDIANVSEIYLGRNRINKGRVKDQIRSLENKYSLYL